MKHRVGPSITEMDPITAINHLIGIAKALIDTSDLDADTMAEDCLSVFDEYEWMPRDGVDKQRFDDLLDSGVRGELDKDGLDEFMNLIDPVGETHLYYWICVAQSLPESVGGDE